MKFSRSRRTAVLVLAAAMLATGLGTEPPQADAAGVEDLLVEALPPGARQLLAGIRIIDGLGTRNSTYREAHHLQGELRAHYDARIETAQRQLANREQLGLRESQVQAYMRVVTALRAERDAAIQITEDEKQAAKYAFESRLRTELLGAVARSPKGQAVLRGIRGTLSEMRDKFGQIQAVLEGENPISIVAADIQEHVDRLRSAGAVMSVLSGSVGAELTNKATAVQGLLDKVTGATDEAAAAGQEILGALDGAIGTLDNQIDSPRRARAAADLVAEEAMEAVLDAIFTPGGETPAEDVIADAIARGFDRNLVQNVGVALGEIDPTDLRTMRERVRAALLASRLERIAEKCGRLTGALQRAAIAALSNDTDPPESIPCSLFRNPEALQKFINEFGTQTTQDSTTTTEPPTDATTTTTTEPPTTTTTTTEAPITFPRTYAGTGTVTYSTSDYEGSCVWEGQTLSATLLPDGAVTATWTSVSGTFSGGVAPAEGEKGTIQCHDPGDPVTSILEGHHEFGHVVIYGAEGPPQVVGEGDYTAQGLVIEYLFQHEYENNRHSSAELRFELVYQDG